MQLHSFMFNPFSARHNWPTNEPSYGCVKPCQLNLTIFDNKSHFINVRRPLYWQRDYGAMTHLFLNQELLHSNERCLIHTHIWSQTKKQAQHVCLCVLGAGLTLKEFDPRNKVGISAAKTYLPHDYHLLKPDAFSKYLCADCSQFVHSH